MAQEKSFFAGIPGQENLDPKQLQDTLQHALRQAAQAGAPALQAFSRIHERRAARLADMAKVLQEKLGKDHPQVVALESLAGKMTALKGHLADQATRVKRWPTPRTNEWMVFGTVTDEQGEPASGLIVRVYDRDRKYDDLLGETTTDEFGGFSVVYHERDFMETGEAQPDLYVMVSDTDGNTLYTSRDNIRFEAGRSEYFAIGLKKRA
jgi:hypothetical protein